jgi:hypothetical protein
MELKEFRDTISVYAGRWETKLELPVETEIMIPDYLPAVFKIVKCLISPVLMQNQISESHWKGEGYLRCTVYYQSDETGSCLCRTEQKFPFEKTVELPAGQTAAGAAAWSGEVEYSNCRAVSEHRIELRGAYLLNLSAPYQTEKEVLTSLADCGIEQRTEALHGCLCLACEEKTYTASGTIQLPGAGETILDAGGYAELQSVTVRQGGVDASGSLHMQVCYRPASGGDIVGRTKDLTIQQSIELPGAAEGDLCCAWGEVLGCTLTENEGKEETELTVTWKLHAELWRKAEYMAVTDAFSTVCETQVEQEDCTLLGEIVAVDLSTQAEIRDDLPDSAAEIKGCFLTLGSAATAAGEDGTILAGKGTAHVLCADERGEISCLDKEFTWSFPQQYPGTPEEYQAHLHADVCGISSGREENKFGVTVKIEVRGALIRLQKHSLAAKVTLGEEFAGKGDGPSLYVYFVQQEQPIFAVAKRYHARIKDLMAANQLEATPGQPIQDTSVPAGCLLIPAAL